MATEAPYSQLNPNRPKTVLADFGRIVSLPGSDGQPRVIVGGQAVNVWAEHYLEKEAELGKFVPLHSKDLDLLGTLADLQMLAQQTGFKVQCAENKIFIPSAGYLEMPLPNGETVKIEILKRIYGVRSEHLHELAIDLLYHDKNIRLIDPITLLKAKIENAVHLPQNESGRERQDAKHMRVMALCVRAYLREGMQATADASYSPKQVIDLFETTLGYVVDESAKQAEQMYGMKWQEVFPLKELRQSKEPKFANFLNKRLPRIFPEIGQEEDPSEILQSIRRRSPRMDHGKRSEREQGMEPEF